MGLHVLRSSKHKINLNPVFLKRNFYLTETERLLQSKYKYNLKIPERKQVRFGSESLKYLCLTIWKTLPHHIKSSKNLQNFKKEMNFWNKENFRYSVC